MKTGHFITILLCIFCISKVHSQYITTNESYTAQQLVETVLFGNSCASVSNVSVSGANFTSGEKSWGFFDANGSGFPFQNGIILSSGKISNAPGPNTYISDDGGTINWGGDTDLNNALNINNSINATVLEFDFIPLGTTISFNYMLSSEEYHGTAPCQYSDGFAFLLKEVGSTTYQNLAVIPNTSIPVKVTSVRPEIPGNCAAQNEQYFGGFNTTNHPTNYNGQTIVMTAFANVTAGTQYHIKLVIADEGNYRYDSAIFLEGSSFSFNIDFGNDRTIATNNPVCPNESITLDAYLPNANSYQWFFNSTPITGETNATLSFTPPYTTSLNGEYTVAVNFGANCNVTGTYNLEFAEDLEMATDFYKKCDDDDIQNGITSFTTTDFDAIRTNLFTNVPTNYTIDFFENNTDTTPISIPYTPNSNSTIIYAKITNLTQCYPPYPITLTTTFFPETITNETLGICNNSPTTLYADTGFTSYLWNTNETTDEITVTNAGTYAVIITNSENCSKTKEFTVINSEVATIENIIITDLSTNNSATCIVSGSGNYEYSIDGINYQNNATFYQLQEGEYQMYVRDKNDCGIATDSFYILDYPKFFTPNNDGYNDFWNIANLDKRNLENSKIYIFDRYGKFITQIQPNTMGWNGTFNGQPLPSNDYWFVLQMPNGKTVKNHFTLKR